MERSPPRSFVLFRPGSRRGEVIVEDAPLHGLLAGAFHRVEQPAPAHNSTAGVNLVGPGSQPDEVDARVLVEAPGPLGVLRTVQFARGESDEGLDVLQPIVIEGVLVVIRHPARGQFRAVVELQVREAIRAASFVPSH